MIDLCRFDDIPEGEARGFEVGEQAVLIIRRQGQLYAYHNHCPHRGIRLEWQPDQFLDYEKQYIQCATHGALLTIEQGECIAGPCPGEQLDPVRVYVEGDRILISL